MLIDISHNHITTAFGGDPMPQLIVKTSLLPRQAMSDTSGTGNYVTSTDIEADEYASTVPLLASGRPACGSHTAGSAENAMGSSGGTYAINGSALGDRIDKHPSFHFAAPIQRVHVKVVELNDDPGQSEGALHLDADYVLTCNNQAPGGCTDLPATAIAASGAHKNWTPLAGPINTWRKYRVNVSGNGLSENLELKSGLFRVIANSSSHHQAKPGHIEALEPTRADTARPVPTYAAYQNNSAMPGSIPTPYGQNGAMMGMQPSPYMGMPGMGAPGMGMPGMGAPGMGMGMGAPGMGMGAPGMGMGAPGMGTNMRGLSLDALRDVVLIQSRSCRKLGDFL